MEKSSFISFKFGVCLPSVDSNLSILHGTFHATPWVHKQTTHTRNTIRHFTDEEKQDKWARIVAPVGSEGVVEKREATGPAPVHSSLTLHASLISPSTTLTHILPPASNSLPSKAYVHLVQTSGYNPREPNGAQITLSGPEGSSVELREGDGVYITGDAGQTLSVRNSRDRVAEVLLFDVE